MKTLYNRLVLSLLSLVGMSVSASQAKADTVVIDPDTYAAVAYSPSTGKYGYAWNHYSRAAAERTALSRCTEKDATVVGWVNDGILAVAIGDDNAYGMGYQFGDGASTRDAVNRALRNLVDRTTGSKDPKVLIVLCSGNVTPQIIKK